MHETKTQILTLYQVDFFWKDALRHHHGHHGPLINAGGRAACRISSACVIKKFNSNKLQAPPSDRSDWLHEIGILQTTNSMNVWSIFFSGWQRVWIRGVHRARWLHPLRGFCQTGVFHHGNGVAAISHPQGGQANGDPWCGRPSLTIAQVRFLHEGYRQNVPLSFTGENNPIPGTQYILSLKIWSAKMIRQTKVLHCLFMHFYYLVLASGW